MSEQVMSGPREGFTEPLVVNLSMLLRRLRTNDLKMRNFSIGKRTNTLVCV
jgi:spore germination protein KA